MPVLTYSRQEFMRKAVSRLREASVKWVMGDPLKTRRVFKKFGPDNHTLSKGVEWVNPHDLYEDDMDAPRDPKGVESYRKDLRSGKPIPPILAEDTGMVWDGHHRWTAAIKEGVEEIPVIRIYYR